MKNSNSDGEFHFSKDEEKSRNEKNEKGVWDYFPAASLCVLIYLCLGFIWNLWHPGWLVFLIVPLFTAVMKKNYKALFPFIIIAIYLCLGFIWNLWHPGWLVFLTIPLFYAVIGAKTLSALIYSLYPLFTVIVYLCLGFIWNLWHPGWLVFLTIPVFNGFAAMIRRSKRK